MICTSCRLTHSCVPADEWKRTGEGGGRERGTSRDWRAGGRCSWPLNAPFALVRANLSPVQPFAGRINHPRWKIWLSHGMRASSRLSGRLELPSGRTVACRWPPSCCVARLWVSLRGRRDARGENFHSSLSRCRLAGRITELLAAKLASVGFVWVPTGIAASQPTG